MVLSDGVLSEEVPVELESPLLWGGLSLGGLGGPLGVGVLSGEGGVGGATVGGVTGAGLPNISCTGKGIIS